MSTFEYPQDKDSYAYSPPLIKANFKQIPSDFLVQEQLSFEPDGKGSHAFLWLEKNSLNTQHVIQILAQFTGLAAKHIGYAGLKDKQSISTQWFSINLEGLIEPDWTTFSHPQIRIKKVTYHQRKLKIGTLKANHFTILLRDIQPYDEKFITSRLKDIHQYGVPNYFGRQRFGIDNQNLIKAENWFSKKIKITQRAQKSIILSAARSYLFNQLLSQRIKLYGWHQLITGEIMMLAGTRSIFNLEAPVDNDIISRFEQADIHPTLTLWGQGELKSDAQLLALESNLRLLFPQWCKSLEHKGLKQARRALRVIPTNLTAKYLEKQHLQLQFTLPKGCYATSLLRELIDF